MICRGEKLGTLESRGSHEEKECGPSLPDLLPQSSVRRLGEDSRGGGVVKGSPGFSESWEAGRVRDWLEPLVTLLITAGGSKDPRKELERGQMEWERWA